MADEMSAPVLGGASVHDLDSTAVGDAFRIFVCPCGDAPTRTLVVTDANGLFGLAVDTVRLMQIPALTPATLVVGVGYPQATSMVDTIDRRGRDLTPTPSSMFADSGGADRFLEFLRSELRPWIAERHPRAVDDLTYFGHSLGGLFGAHALLAGGDLFDRYILSSPSLWWDRGEVFDRARSRRDLRGSVFVGIGGLETDEGRRAEATNLPAGHPAKPPATFLDMVADTHRFVDLLRDTDASDLALEAVEIPDEYHATVPGIVLSRALRAFGHAGPGR